MTTSRRKRGWGDARNKPALNTRISTETKAVIDDLADARAISQGQALDALLACVTMRADGTILWADHEAQNPVDETEVLPLSETA